MTFFKMNCFKALPQDENPSDITVDVIVTELLSYFRGFPCFLEAKAEIEIKCVIEEKRIWSVNDIKRAWTKTANIKKTSSQRKHWSFVIVLEELKRRVFNDLERQKKEAEPDLKENEDTQACGTAERKEKTDRRSLESDTEKKTVSDASQAAERLQKTLILEEPTRHNISQENWHIRIPLLKMSETKSSIVSADPCKKRKTMNTHYKLKNGCPSDNEITIRKSYAMSYNYDTNNADWVYEILNKSTLINRCPDVKDCVKAGYDNGHLASAANHRWCVEAKNDASLFSNLTPQTKSLNGGVWKRLEYHCRNRVKENKVRNVHVYTGPLYSNTKKEVVGVKALPSHFFKVIIVEEEDGIVKMPECYCMPNSEIDDNRPMEDFTVNITVIEKESQLTFVEKSNSTISESVVEITLEGKDLFEQSCTAEIKVSIIK